MLSQVTKQQNYSYARSYVINALIVSAEVMLSTTQLFQLRQSM